MPRSWYIDANSTPTAPLPTTTMSFGSESDFRTSSLVTIRLPSTSRPGSDLTREPVARITSFASRTRSPPLPGVPSSPGWLTRTFVGPSRRPRPCDPGDLVLVDQRLQAGPESLDDLVAAGGHLDVVDLGLAGELQAEVLRVPDAIGEGGRFEQRLGRDAAAVEARPADLVLVDERDLEPQLGRPERGRVAAGAGAEDDEIERVGRADGHVVRGLGLAGGSRRDGTPEVPPRGFGRPRGRYDLGARWTDRPSCWRSSSRRSATPVGRCRSGCSWPGRSAGRTRGPWARGGPARQTRCGRSARAGRRSSSSATC